MRWRRFIARALVLLIMGAAVNIAVAWGCALWSPLGKTTYVRESEDIRGSVVEVPRDMGRPIKSSIVYTTKARGLHISARDDLSRLEGGSFVYTDSASFACSAGWPFHSMHGSRTFYPTHGDSTLLAPPWPKIEMAPMVTGLFTRPGPMHRALPTVPIALGFAANSLIYAAILFVPCLLLLALRQQLRRRHNRCTACAYQLTGEPICPECGTTTPTTRRKTPRNPA